MCGDNCNPNNASGILRRFFLVAGIAALAAVPQTASAGCTTSGKTVTCKGSLDETDTSDYSYSSDVDTLIFDDLDDSYSISSGDVFTSLTDVGDDGVDTGDAGTAGSNLTITYDPGTDKGFEVSKNTTGIGISSQGGEGGEGVLPTDYDNPVSAEGGGGGASGDGGTATVTIENLSSTYSDTGLTISGVDIGIAVTSVGGIGGKGGRAKCDGVNGGETDCMGQGGQGGDGGAASVSVTDTDVSITDFSETGISIASVGGEGGKGGTTSLNGGEQSWADNDGKWGRGGEGGDGGTAYLALDGSTATVSDSSGEADVAISVTSIGWRWRRRRRSRSPGHL